MKTENSNSADITDSMNPKTIGIVTDTHSSITPAEAERLGVIVLPMPFYINGATMYEGYGMTREDVRTQMEAGADVSTSQPSPADVVKVWDQALLKYDQILYLPISSGLSGSCMIASCLAEEDQYKGRVFVVDHGRISTPLHRLIIDAQAMIRRGYSAGEIKEKLERERAGSEIFVAVDNLKYLAKGGRLAPFAAAAASIVKVKPILFCDTGLFHVHKICRGMKKAKKTLIELLKNELSTKFGEDWKNHRIHILAASSASKEETMEWVKEVENAFPGYKVMWDYLSLGITCHIGYGVFGIGCSRVPAELPTELSTD